MKHQPYSSDESAGGSFRLGEPKCAMCGTFLTNENIQDECSRDLSKESEDRVVVQERSVMQSVCTSTDSIFALFKASFARLFLSRTTELQDRLRDKDAEMRERLKDKENEILWLRSQIDVLQSRLNGFEDSFLSSKGMLPINPEKVNQVNVKSQSVIPNQPGMRLHIESEVDKLKEILIYKPEEALEQVKDLEAQNNPTAKEILRRYFQWVNELPDDDRTVSVATN